MTRTVTKSVREGITEHITLPDPMLYRRIVVKNCNGDSSISPGYSPFTIQASRALSSVPGAMPYNSKALARLDLCTCSSVEEAKAIKNEMQKRMNVARKLLGLPL